MAGDFFSTITPIQQRSIALLFGALIVGVWLLGHPYQGLFHDAVLYVGQSLYRLNPDRFSNDLFFSFGSQSSYTIFPDIFSKLISIWGVSNASFAYVAFAHLIWLCAAFHLFRNAFGHLPGLIAVLCVAILPSTYGSMTSVAYGEGFATARPLAEAMTLFGISLILFSRTVLGVGLIALAGLLHPLTALVGALAGFIFLCLGNQRYLIVLPAALLVALAFAFAGISPFDGLLTKMDADWFEIVKRRNQYVFLTEWVFESWAQVISRLAFLITAAGIATGPGRQLCIASVIASVLAFALSFIGSDLLHNVFIIQIQLWRIDWILAVTGNAAVGYLIFRSVSHPTRAFPLATVLFTYLLWSFIPVVMAAGAPLVAFLLWQNLRHDGQPASARFNIAVIGFFAYSVLSLAFLRGQNWLTMASSGDLSAGYAVQTTDFLLAVAPVAAASQLFPKARIFALVAAALVAFGSGVTAWDRRPESRAMIEDFIDQENPFDDLLSKQATIYWPDHLVLTWVILKRSSYYEYQQGAGVLLSRRVAFAFMNRADQLLPLDRKALQPFWPDNIQLRNTRSKLFAVPTSDKIKAACQAANGALDALVLPTKIGHLVSANWTIPAGHSRVYSGLNSETDAKRRDLVTYWLYLCETVLSNTEKPLKIVP